MISNRDFGFDHVIISLHASISSVEKPCRGERLDVRMDIAVTRTTYYHLPLGPRFRGDDGNVCLPQPAVAGVRLI